jgi:hypothetical protein
MVERSASEFALFKNHVLHKDKQCILGSKVERLGSRMIRESLNQRKAYPIDGAMLRHPVGNPKRKV